MGMKNRVHIISVAEKSEMKNKLLQYIKKSYEHLVTTESLIGGIDLIKEQSFNFILLSNDIENSYAMKNVIQTLAALPNIQSVVLVSEQPIQSVTSAIDKVFALQLSNPETDAQIILNNIEEVNSLVTNTSHYQKNMVSASSEHSATNLVDTVPIGLFRISPQGDFLECNFTFFTILEAPYKDVILEDNLFSFFCDEEERNDFKEIITKEGHTQGHVVQFERYDKTEIWLRISIDAQYDDNEEILSFVGSIEDITFQKDLDSKLSFLSNHDILTGLPNKNFFQLQAELTFSQARYGNDQVAIFLIDIDNFSSVNEQYGNDKGDEILRVCAHRIKQLLRKSDLLARYKGDSFLALLSGVSSRTDILAVAQKITTGFTQPLAYKQYSLILKLNIGISIFPKNGDQVIQLINRANHALNAVKERERGGYMISRL